MIDPNEPAFPVPPNETRRGITIRIHFAAMAMQGILSNSHFSADKDTVGSLHDAAVYHADALIAALNKGGE